MSRDIDPADVTWHPMVAGGDLGPPVGWLLCIERTTGRPESWPEGTFDGFSMQLIPELLYSPDGVPIPGAWAAVQRFACQGLLCDVRDLMWFCRPVYSRLRYEMALRRN